MMTHGRMLDGGATILDMDLGQARREANMCAWGAGNLTL